MNPYSVVFIEPSYIKEIIFVVLVTVCDTLCHKLEQIDTVFNTIETSEHTVNLKCTSLIFNVKMYELFETNKFIL